jgi:hypothetical protein
VCVKIVNKRLSLQVAIDSMRALGMSEFQIEEIMQTRVAPTEVRVYSPINGYVIARNISPQQRFDKGTEMYRIADISHVWVMTDIFEKDAPLVRPGTRAAVRYQGREFEARMSDVLPQLDPQSRTLKARFELENPNLILRPDAFVDVHLVETVRQSPRSLGLEFSNWTLPKLSEYVSCKTGRHMGRHAVADILHARKINMRRPRLKVTSPDPDYAEKRGSWKAYSTMPQKTP